MLSVCWIKRTDKTITKFGIQDQQHGNKSGGQQVARPEGSSARRRFEGTLQPLLELR